MKRMTNGMMIACASWVILGMMPAPAAAEQVGSDDLPWGLEKGGLRAAGIVEKRTFVAGEDITLSMVVRNFGDARVPLVKSRPPIFDCVIDVKLLSGKPAPSGKQALPRVGGGSLGSLAAGATSTIEIPLSRYFDMTAPGIYRVSVQRLIHENLWVSRPLIEIEVLPAAPTTQPISARHDSSSSTSNRLKGTGPFS